MNKTDLINAVAEQAELTKADAGRALEAATSHCGMAAHAPREVPPVYVAATAPKMPAVSQRGMRSAGGSSGNRQR